MLPLPLKKTGVLQKNCRTLFDIKHAWRRRRKRNCPLIQSPWPEVNTTKDTKNTKGLEETTFEIA